MGAISAHVEGSGAGEAGVVSGAGGACGAGLVTFGREGGTASRLEADGVDGIDVRDTVIGTAGLAGMGREVVALVLQHGALRS